MLEAVQQLDEGRHRGRRRFNPSDALALLQDEDRHLDAADLAGNPAYHHADARSRGHDGQRLVDFHRNTTKTERAAMLAELVSLPAKEFAEKIPPLLVKTINQAGVRAPWGPWGDPTFTQIGCEDWFGLLGSGKPRRVAIPCPTRRMLDTLFERILIDTGDHMVHRTAWAYRPGKHDAVPAVIKEVRRGVREGGRYYAKLDIRSFFPTMPWKLIETTLSDPPFSYPREFTQKVMALVMAPLVDEQGRAVPNTSGSQAGTRTSGVIANMVLRAVDDLVCQRFGNKVHYWRYSDDILIVGRNRDDVIGATRAVQKWCHENGLKLKGVGHRFSSQSLVHDITKRRIEILGAEINRRGDVVPQKDRLENFRARLAHRLAWMLDGDRRQLAQMMGDNHPAWLHDDHEIVVGLSNYDTRFAKRGRYRYDGEDVQVQLDQFEQHWDALNRRFTTDFLGTLCRDLAIDPGEPGPKTTWVAWLPTGRRFVQARPGNQLQEAKQRLRLVGASRSFDTLGAFYASVTLQGQPEPGNRGRLPSRDEEDELVDLYGDHLAHPDHLSCGTNDADEGIDSTCRGSTRGGRSPGASGLPQGEDPRGTIRKGHSLREQPLHREELGEATYSFDSASPESSRREDEGQGGAFSGDVQTITDGGLASPLWALKTRVLHVRTSMSKPRGKVATSVFIERADRDRAASDRRVYDGLRPAAALVEVLIDEVLAARADGVEMLMVSLDSNWLPKALVQRSRRFRHPGLFSRVLHLHEVVRACGVELLLGGP